MDRIPDLLLSALRVFAAMSPWLVAGFFAAGVLAVWIPRAWVNRANPVPIPKYLKKLPSKT